MGEATTPVLDADSARLYHHKGDAVDPGIWFWCIGAWGLGSKTAHAQQKDHPLTTCGVMKRDVLAETTRGSQSHGTVCRFTDWCGYTSGQGALKWKGYLKSHCNQLGMSCNLALPNSFSVVTGPFQNNSKAAQEKPYVLKIVPLHTDFSKHESEKLENSTR